MAVDTLFKQNLVEWVYDEHQLVTYLHLSTELGVNVNLAKQMLYEFYKDEEKKEQKIRENRVGGQIQALYYVSGLIPDGTENTIYTTTICRDELLTSVKEKFVKLFSVYIYAVVAIETLNENGGSSVMKKKLSDAISEENFVSHSEYGPFKVEKRDRPSQVDVITSSIPVLMEEKSVPEIAKKVSAKLVKKETSPPLSNAPAEKQPKRQEVSLSSNMKTNQKKSVFEGKQSKPFFKSKPTAIELDSDSKSMKDEEEMKHSSSKTVEVSNKRHGKRTRKPTTIHSDTDSDSDSLREQRRGIGSGRSKKEMDTHKEEHRKRIRMLVDSDTDEDEIKPAPVPQHKNTTSLVPEVVNKKRKTKVITTHVMDEDGYLVTKREKVSDSESEGERNDATTLKMNSPPRQLKSKSEEKPKPPSSPPKKSRSSGKPKPSAAAGSKQKQTTLTSFFTKKS